jgi:hypothetical protein
MEAIIINVEGKKRKIEINTIEEAKKIVCNFKNDSVIEIVELNDGTAMIIDEEGKLKNYQFNEKATLIAREKSAIFPSDFIVGDVLIVDIDEFDGLPYE